MALDDAQKETKLRNSLRGNRYRMTHKHSVQAILGKLERPVISQGIQFYNVDRWTGRFFLGVMCAWAQEHPGCIPTQAEICVWVNQANAEKVPSPHIVIASTPEILPARLAMALTGGAYHEALHTWMSCRRDLRLEEMAPLVIPRWAKVPNWNKYLNLLLGFSNIIEDIHIERRGIEWFPGIDTKLHDLQDFVLKLEMEGRQNVRAHGGKGTGGSLSTICAVFRDLGLGYKTTLQQAALAEYTKTNPEAVALVADLQGPLHPLLLESINLPRHEDLGCIRMALDAVSILYKLGKAQEETPEPKHDGKRNCPQCLSDESKLVVRLKARPTGPGSIPNQGVLTCIVCGWQQPVQIVPDLKGSGFNSSGDKDKGKIEIKIEIETPTSNKEASIDPQDKAKSPTAGGHHYDPEPHPGNDFTQAIKQALAQAEEGQSSGLLDNNSAFADAIRALRDKENEQILVDPEGEIVEAPWRPFDPSLDEVRLVRPSARKIGQMENKENPSWGKEHDQAQADMLLASVKEQTGYLRAKLRNQIRALEMTTVVHGIRHGLNLSMPNLVDTVLSLKNQKAPLRAFYQKEAQLDVSFAAAIVLDQSLSMLENLPLVTQVLCAITEPLDFLGCAVQVSGFRDGREYGLRVRTELDLSADDIESGPYHRFEGVIHDVFKTFGERFSAVRWRFANTRAGGGTPMADGVQFGLDSLSTRKEGHRALFVITDGMPNPGHIPVMRRQFRFAREAGIPVIGVGLGETSLPVLTLFEDSVWSNDIQKMPKMLAAKLGEILDPQTRKRGRRLRTE